MEAQKEIWKDIKDFEGLYQVSNHGRVRSLDRIVKRSKGGDMKMKGKIKSAHVNTNGYPSTTLYKGDFVKRKLVHSLVAAAFIGKRPSKHDVNHIDGDKTNNHVSNLEYCTRSENMIHAFATGLCKNTRKQQRRGVNSVKNMILNFETGVFYDSVVEAAKAHNIYLGSLEKQLGGHRKLSRPLMKVGKHINGNFIDG